MKKNAFLEEVIWKNFFLIIPYFWAFEGFWPRKHSETMKQQRRVWWNIKWKSRNPFYWVHWNPSILMSTMWKSDILLSSVDGTQKIIILDLVKSLFIVFFDHFPHQVRKIILWLGPHFDNKKSQDILKTISRKIVEIRTSRWGISTLKKLFRRTIKKHQFLPFASDRLLWGDSFHFRWTPKSLFFRPSSASNLDGNSSL